MNCAWCGREIQRRPKGSGRQKEYCRDDKCRKERRAYQAKYQYYERTGRPDVAEYVRAHG